MAIVVNAPRLTIQGRGRAVASSGPVGGALPRGETAVATELTRALIPQPTALQPAAPGPAVPPPPLCGDGLLLRLFMLYCTACVVAVLQR